MEVVAEVRRHFPVSTKKSEWGVLGWSMGGFGAVHFAEKHPQVVNFVGSIIGLPITHGWTSLPDGQRFPINASVFGTDASGWARENPLLHVRSLRGKDIVVVIRTEAFDRTMNENFVRARPSPQDSSRGASHPGCACIHHGCVGTWHHAATCTGALRPSDEMTLYSVGARARITND